MLTTFDEIIEITLEHEGGYVHDPKDLGGETNFGIAGRFYPDVDIKNLTKEGAKEIYKKDYWDKNKVDELDILLKELSKKLNSKYTVVTSGSEGVKILQKKNNNIVKCPAFGTKVIDKVGTGDTMLVTLALSFYMKNNIYFSMLLASLAAAQNIQFMANSKTINRVNLIKSIQSYLK